MPFYKNKYRIESNRLKNWDYSSKGIYFITICCANRECLFGEVLDDKMILNKNGEIVSEAIKMSINIREKWVFHNWVIMPNHLNFLIEIKEVEPKFNFSTKRILNDAIPIEIRNLFLARIYISEKSDCSPTQRNVIDDGYEDRIEKSDCSPTQLEKENKLYRRPKSISSFVAQFKSKVTKQINFVAASNDSIWQSNYHDSIIRSQEVFQKVYFYIQNNPKNWDVDSLK